jgi:hypothetical protein
MSHFWRYVARYSILGTYTYRLDKILEWHHNWTLTKEEVDRLYQALCSNISSRTQLNSLSSNQTDSWFSPGLCFPARSKLYYAQMISWLSSYPHSTTDSFTERFYYPFVTSKMKPSALFPTSFFSTFLSTWTYCARWLSLSSTSRSWAVLPKFS